MAPSSKPSAAAKNAEGSKTDGKADGTADTVLLDLVALKPTRLAGAIVPQGYVRCRCKFRNRAEARATIDELRWRDWGWLHGNGTVYLRGNDLPRTAEEEAERKGREQAAARRRQAELDRLEAEKQQRAERADIARAISERLGIPWAYGAGFADRGVRDLPSLAECLRRACGDAAERAELATKLRCRGDHFDEWLRLCDLAIAADGRQAEKAAEAAAAKREEETKAQAEEEARYREQRQQAIDDLRQLGGVGQELAELLMEQGIGSRAALTAAAADPARFAELVALPNVTAERLSEWTGVAAPSDETPADGKADKQAENGSN